MSSSDPDDARDRAELYRMWRTSYAAGLTHPRSLDAMGERASRHTEDARLWLLRGTERGRDITSLVRAAGGRFEDFEITLLAFGEESGHLDDALRLLGDFYARKHRLMLWVKKKSAYPFFTLLAACFIAPFPLLFFGYTFAYVAAAFTGITLLLLTAHTVRAVIAAHFGRTPALVRARFARALATAIRAGLPLPRALRLAADASAHPEIRNFVRRIPEQKLATSSASDSLAACPHLTPEFRAVLQTAERTGDFAALERLAELYEDGFR